MMITQSQYHRLPYVGRALTRTPSAARVTSIGTTAKPTSQPTPSTQGSGAASTRAWGISASTRSSSASRWLSSSPYQSTHPPEKVPQAHGASVPEDVGTTT